MPTQPALVAIEHGCKPTSDAAVVELHFRLGPNASNTVCRCCFVNRPRSSSSWLRRNIPHYAVAGRVLVVFSAAASGWTSAAARA